MNDREHLNRAAHAQELLDNPLIIEALEAFEKEVIEQWKQAPARDAEGREKLWLMLQAHQRFKKCLLTMVETGKLISLQQTPTERLRRVVGLN